MKWHLLITKSRPIDHLASPTFISFYLIHGNVSFSLSLEGLFNLLDNIEGRLHGERTSVYRDSSIDARQLNRIIRYALLICRQTLQCHPSQSKPTVVYIYLTAMEQLVLMRKTYYPSAKGSHFR